MNLTDIYKSIIQSLGKDIDDNHGVYGVSPSNGKKLAAIVKLDGKELPLRLPVREVLASDDQQSYVGFHPLSESHLRGESTVNIWLRRAIRARLMSVVGGLMLELLHAATSEDVKASADPDLIPLLKAVNNADAKTVDSLEKALRKVDGEKNVLCNVFIKRDGEIKIGDEVKKYDRACIVRFPVPMDNPKELWGVPLRVGKIKDLDIFRGVLNVIIPNWDTDEYCTGSNAHSTPYFRSLMTSYFKVANAINKCVNRHRSILEDHEELLIDTSWYSIMGELDNYMDEIPSLPGNIGTRNGKENAPKFQMDVNEGVAETREAAPEQPAPAAAPAPQYQEPAHTPPPTGGSHVAPANTQYASTTTSESASSAWLSQRDPNPPVHQQPQQPIYATAQPQPQFYDQYGNPVYQQPPQQQLHDQYGRPVQQAAPNYGYATAPAQSAGHYAPPQQHQQQALSPREAYLARKEGAQAHAPVTQYNRY